MQIEYLSSELVRPGSEIRAREVVVAAPTVHPETRAGDVFTMLAERPDRPSLAVINSPNEIVGLIDRAKLLAAFGQTYGRSVYEGRPIHKLMDPRPMVVPSNTGVDKIVEWIANEFPSALTSGFIVIEDGTYFGIGVPIKLMSKVAQQAAKRSRALEDAHRKAEAASQAKSVFLATVSHEIRTPLNGVIGNLELIRFTELSNDQAELVDSAEVSAQTLLGIIGDVLDFSKIEAGRITFEMTDITTVSLLEDVRNLLISKAIQKGLNIETYIGPDVPARIKGDSFRLRQILMNFVSNAVKFTESGGVFLSLTSDRRDDARHGDDERVRLRFECTDTGRGFAPEKADALFEEFIQEDSSTTRRFGGTGLGLAICRKVVTMLGGDIGAIGAPGYGAKFWTELPFEVVDDTAVYQDASLSGLRALLVGFPAADGTKQGGQSGTPEITFAATLSSAIRFSAEASKNQSPFNAIIVSQLLSDVSWDQAARHFDTAKSLLVLVRAYDDENVEYLAYRAGYRVVLPKNMNAATLRHVLSVAAVNGLPQKTQSKPSPENDPLDVILLGRDRSKPILVIDDTEMNRLVARRQLDRLGFRCDEAENGAEALLRVQERDYAMALVDMAMPVMDGLQFARELRRREAMTGQRMPLVAMTGNVQEADRQAALASGMDGFLTKPVRIEKLAEGIARVLPPQAATTSARRAPQPTTDDVIAGSSEIVDMDFSNIGPSLDLASLEEMIGPDGHGVVDDGLASEVLSVGDAPPSGDPRSSALSDGDETNGIDLELLKRNLGIADEAILIEILGTFLTSFDGLALRMQLALDHEDRDALRKAAHAAKGAARNAAAVKLGDLLAEIETQSGTTSFDDLRSVFEHCQSLYRAAKSTIIDRAKAA